MDVPPHDRIRGPGGASVQAAPDRPTTAAPARALVLVVVADAATRELIARSLGSAVHVLGVGSAEQAVTALRHNRPGAIVCELELPGASGEGFIARLRSDARFDEVPAIVISGHHDDGLRLRLLQTGASDVVEKPFSLAELEARVRNVLTPALRNAELRARTDEVSELASQLQVALESRVVIEQAKAFIAAEQAIDLPAAFELLRSLARSRRAPIQSVAREVVRLRGLGDGVAHRGCPECSARAERTID